MSDGASTTQISERSRRGSGQIGRAAPRLRLKHSAQKPTRSLTYADRLGQRERLLGGHAQQVEREPLGRALADARQARELRHQRVDRRASSTSTKPGSPSPPSPPVIAPMRSCCSAAAWRKASVTAASTMSCEQLDLVGVDGLRVDLDPDEVAVARRDRLDHAAAGGRLDALVAELLLRARHLGLHLRRHLHHLLGIDAHPASSVASRRRRS